MLRTRHIHLHLFCCEIDDFCKDRKCISSRCHVEFIKKIGNFLMPQAKSLLVVKHFLLGLEIELPQEILFYIVCFFSHLLPSTKSLLEKEFESLRLLISNF